MDVDTSDKKDVWLVKVPKYLANSWKSAPPRAELGRLHLPTNGSVKTVKFITDPQFKNNQQVGDQEVNQLPSEHLMNLNPLLHQRMVILAQNRDATGTSGKIAFIGDVKYRSELRPPGDMSYMNLKASSIRQAAKPTRVTQILDKAVTSYKPRGATQLAHEADMRKKKEDAKKLIREDKEIVQGRLFSAFEKQQYYNIKDLVRITNQPIPYLKEVLKEICNYCSKSTNKNMWELKPEYRHYKSASSSK